MLHDGNDVLEDGGDVINNGVVGRRVRVERLQIRRQSNRVRVHQTRLHLNVQKNMKFRADGELAKQQPAPPPPPQIIRCLQRQINLATADNVHAPRSSTHYPRKQIETGETWDEFGRFEPRFGRFRVFDLDVFLALVRLVGILESVHFLFYLRRYVLLIVVFTLRRRFRRRLNWGAAYFWGSNERRKELEGWMALSYPMWWSSHFRNKLEHNWYQPIVHRSCSQKSSNARP